MSHVDEARYGRMSLLLLNVCPFTLRHVINDYYVKHGSTNLQDFLDKNKHDLYHILNRRCCCRLIQSRSTPMNRSQWDLLFIKNSSSCRKGYTGDCPCQYDVKPGVTADVMDITLCCLFIKNICSRHDGINMSHIETIRTIRNDMVHTKSAQLDLLTYNGYRNRVRFALLDLANNVSQTVHTDTLNMIQELENQIMNAGELGEIRKVLLDQKRVEEVEESVSDMTRDLDTTNKTMRTVKGNVSQLEGQVNHLKANVSRLGGIVNQAKAKVDDLEEGLNQTSTQLTKLGKTVTDTAESSKRKFSNLEEAVDGKVDVIKLKQELIRVNEVATRNISISPLQEGDDKVPIELLYASVFIREDPKYAERGNYSFQDRNTASEFDEGRFDSSSHRPTLPSHMFSSSLTHQTLMEPQMQVIDSSRFPSSLPHETFEAPHIPALNTAPVFDLGNCYSQRLRFPSQNQTFRMPNIHWG